MPIVIVSGPEATGKTAVAKEVANRLSYEYLSKDVIKEKLFDTAGHKSSDYKWYEKATKEQFFAEIKKLAGRKVNAVIESNFIKQDQPELKQFIKPEIGVMEIHCRAKGLTTFRRFVKRNESGQRHKGHHDRRWYAKVLIEDLLQYFHITWPSKPTGLTDNLLTVDTTDFSKIDYSAIIQYLNSCR